MSTEGTGKRHSAASKGYKIERTNITVAQVERTLRKHLCTDATLLSWHYEEIGTGKGFLSCLLRMRLTWNGDSGALPKVVIVKIPDLTNFNESFGTGASDAMKQTIEIMGKQLMHFHNNELCIYEMFAGVPAADRPMPMPQYYGGERVADIDALHGYMLMEDLSDTTGCVDVGVGYDRQQMESLADSLARLHAWCLCNEHLWKAAAANADFERLMAPTMDTFIQSFDSFVEWLNEPAHKDYFGEAITSRVAELRPDLGLLKALTTLHREHALPDVLVHGDFRASNILMREGEGAQAFTSEIGAIIDWQIVHWGSPCEDLTNIMLFSCGCDVKADELLRFYHSRLREHLGAEPPFGVSQLCTYHWEMYPRLAGYTAPFMQQFVNMLDTGDAIHSDDKAASKAKLLRDTRNMLARGLRIDDGDGGR